MYSQWQWEGRGTVVKEDEGQGSWTLRLEVSLHCFSAGLCSFPSLKSLPCNLVVIFSGSGSFLRFLFHCVLSLFLKPQCWLVCFDFIFMVRLK